MLIVVRAQKRYNTSMLWIIGRTFSELERYLTDRNIPFGLFADKSISTQQTRAINTVYLDYTSEAALQSSLYGTDYEVTGVLLAGYEQYVVPAAWLSAYFNVPGPSVQAAIAATNKAAMRQALRAADKQIAPAWAAIASTADLDHFAQRHGYPLILKPTSLMKSLFITKNTDKNMLQHNYQLLRAALDTPKAGSEQPQIIVEEYMAGTMHTLAGFVDKNGNVQLVSAVVDCVTASEIGVNDSYIAERCIPSRLDQKTIDSLQMVAKQGVTALGLRSVALHIEIMLTPSGPKIIEIAARIGGYRARMYKYACSVDLYGGLLATATDQPIDLTVQTSKYSCAIELFPSTHGRITAITNVSAMERLPSVLHVRVQHDIGTVAGPAKDGYRACVVVVLGSNTLSEVKRDKAYIRDTIRISSEPIA